MAQKPKTPAPDIDDIASEILRREGGYVNDPDDPGGPTNFGVTLRALRGLRPDASLADLKALRSDEARQIFKTQYFFRPKIDQLPKILQASVFDMQVNAGANAIKILQRLLASFEEPVAVDGALGPQSIAAARRVADAAAGFLPDAYAIARRDYYFDLADRRPKSRKYARTRAGGKGGWIKRAEEFMAEKYHLGDAQFAQRISTWA